MTTKNELAETLTAAGVTLPLTWGKFSTTRAQAWADAALYGDDVDPQAAPAKPKRVSFAKTFGAIAGAVLGATVASAGVVVPLPELDNLSAEDKTATMPKDPKWRRSTGGGRGWNPCKPVEVDLSTASRQVRRATDRRSNKMPLGAKLSVWHDAQGFGKIGSGKLKKSLAKH